MKALFGVCVNSWKTLAVLCALSALPACGPEFDPSSEVKSLRALAVVKDKPYVAQNDSVKLDLVWYDGKRSVTGELVTRPIQVGWYTGCINPPGDVYYGCFDQIAASLAEANEKGQPGALFTPGTTAQVSFTKEVLEAHPRDYTGDFHYDIGIAFFVLCAGNVGFGTPSEDTPFPVLCTSPDGEALGAEDFVVGYTSVYSFHDASVTNASPKLGTQFTFNGQVVNADCVDAACSANVPATEPDCDNPDQAKLCVPVCEDDGDQDCPEYVIKPSLDPDDVEADLVSTVRDKRDLQKNPVREQMWINYYVDRGGVSSEVRLLNDVKAGWNDKYESKFRAPKDPGLVRVWAAAHDSRGGTSIARLTIRAR